MSQPTLLRDFLKSVIKGAIYRFTYAIIPGKFDFQWTPPSRTEMIATTPQKDIFIGQLIEPDSKILDLGCGDGHLLKYLHATKNVTGIGIDIQLNKVDLALQRGVEAYVGNLDDLESELMKNILSQEWDYVVSVLSMMYWQYPERIVKDLGKVSRYQIHQVSNSGSWERRLRLLFGSFPMSAYRDGITSLYLDPERTKRYWTVSDFVRWGQGLGFVTKPVGVQFGPNIVKPYLGYSLFSSSVIYKLFRSS